MAFPYTTSLLCSKVRSEESGESGPRLPLWQRHSLSPFLPVWVRREEVLGLHPPFPLRRASDRLRGKYYSLTILWASFSEQGTSVVREQRVTNFGQQSSNVQPTTCTPGIAMNRPQHKTINIIRTFRLFCILGRG